MTTAVETPTLRPITGDEIDQLVRSGDLLPDDAPSEWWCVRTAPFPCPAEGCSYVAEFLTCAHLIVVWPSRDDRWLLANAADAARLGRDPKVTRYEPTFGTAIAFDAWVMLGRPIHGSAEDRRPDGVTPPSRGL